MVNDVRLGGIRGYAEFQCLLRKYRLQCPIVYNNTNGDFQPTLATTLGFGYVPTLLLSSPPWAFACIVSLINAWHADRTGEKFWHIVGPIFGGLVGFIISMSTLNTAGRYVALFLQASSYAGYVRVNPLCGLSTVAGVKNTNQSAQIHRILLVDLVIVSSATRKTSSGNRCYQRVQSAGQRGRLLCVGSQRGRISQVIWYRHGYGRRHNFWLLLVQVDAQPAEQEVGKEGTGVGRKR